MATAPYTYELPRLTNGKNRFEGIFDLHSHYIGNDYLDIDEITGSSWVPKAFDTYTFEAPQGTRNIRATIGFSSPYGQGNQIWAWFNSDPMLPIISYTSGPWYPVDGYHFLASPTDSFTTDFKPVKGQNTLQIMGVEASENLIQPVDFWLELEAIGSSKKGKRAQRPKGSNRKQAKKIHDSSEQNDAYKEYTFPSARLLASDTGHTDASHSESDLLTFQALGIAAGSHHL